MVLDERAGPLFEYFGGGEAPTSESARNFVVGKEVAGNFLVADGYKQIRDIVGKFIIGLNEECRCTIAEMSEWPSAS